MTDLLTKEERETVGMVRSKYKKSHRECPTCGDYQAELRDDWIDDLLAIIDNLSKRGVKKYSREHAKKWYRDYYETTPTSQFHAQDCMIAALRHFGVLEEK